MEKLIGTQFEEGEFLSFGGFVDGANPMAPTVRVTSIGDLESRLAKYREERENVETRSESSASREADDKKDKGKKRRKKQRMALLADIFNNADEIAEEEPEKDSDDGSDGKSRKKKDTLDTTYGRRFTPVVSFLNDTIQDFDQIADDIQTELHSPRGQARTMYRSNQIGNLISAKKSKLDAVKELASVAKTISDLEYKRDKDRAAEESDTSKVMAKIGAKFLRGSLDQGSSGDRKGSKPSGGKKKKKGKTMGEYPDPGSKRTDKKPRGEKSDRDDEDEDEESLRRERKREADSDADLARALRNELMGRKGEFTFTPYERNLHVEGKYEFRVLVDPLNTKDWKFVAVNKKGKIIEGFDKEYAELYPKKKQCRMRFDIDKKKCQDLNSGMVYKLLFDE